MSYIPLTAVRAGIGALTTVRRHEHVMAPEQPWEMSKIGTGPPPVRLAYGWLLLYHAVANAGGQLRYCMGAAILDLERPANVLYRTPNPILEPQEAYEVRGLVPNVIFTTATDLRVDGLLDVYYGAADRVIAVARVTLPQELPNRRASNRSSRS